MKSLVTGSNGFIGSHLVDYLLTKGHQVRCLVRKTSNLQWIHHLPVEFVYGDITATETLPPAVEGVDYVFHLGGTVRVAHESEFLRINHGGTINLLKACAEFNPQLKRFVFASSQAAAGPSNSMTPVRECDEAKPISRYGRSKRVAEEAVLDFAEKIPATIVRPPSVYGERDDDFLELFNYVNRGIKMLVGRGDKYISLIYIGDLVRGIYSAALSERSIGEIYFLTDMKPHSSNEIETEIARALNKKPFTIRFPELLIDLYAFVGETMARMRGRVAIVNKDKALEMKQSYWLVDGSKAKSHLDFKTEMSLEAGMKKTAQWYIEQGWLRR
ncbi:NAD(P)-dependent oxidoreductase [candidate division KSB1 bacterium]|nr:NAD(P)-dependent oxidoreductase [candidate division KSB1 bacterium]